jgi:aryl-alcohol dehydrogenase-like predicted oxidoreductase
MEKIQLSNTGVDVSALCLGTDYYGSRTDSKTAHRLLDQYFDAGGRFVDTANVYACWIPGFEGGESETTIGQWLKARQNRHQMVIGTKVGAGPYQDSERGLRAKEIQRECEKSLNRLGIETIDLYYAHIEDRTTPHEETLEAFDRLVQSGKVRLIGASNHKAWRLAEARTISKVNGWEAYCAVEQRYTYLRPKPGTNFGLQMAVNDDFLDYCRENNLTILAYSILLNGAYTRSDRSIPAQYIGPDSAARISTLMTISQELGVTPNQVVIAWMRQSDPPILPIIGGSTPEQISENIGALKIKLTHDQMNFLNEAGA